MLKSAVVDEMSHPELREVIGTVVSGEMRPRDETDPEIVTFSGTVTGIQIADGARRAGLDMVSSGTDGNTISWDRDQYEVTLYWAALSSDAS